MAFGLLRATLRWSQPQGDPAPRLRLGCLWEDRDGAQGAVQALGGLTEAPRRQGRRTLWLLPSGYGDAEEINVNLYRNARFLRRLLLFAYADEGGPRWHELCPVLTIVLVKSLTSGPATTVRMWADDPPEPTGAAAAAAGSQPAPGVAPSTALTAALLSVHFVDGMAVLRREAAYVDGPQAALASAYGWNLHWVQGRTITKVGNTY
jgi:tellurite resistance protein TerA